MVVVVVTDGRDLFSPLGWHIRELMNRKRISGQSELADIVSRNGYVITQPAVSKIIRGKQDASQRFVSALAKGLELSSEERRDLADVFAYGEDTTVEMTEGETRSVEEFERRVVSDEEGPGDDESGGGAS